MIEHTGVTAEELAAWERELTGGFTLWPAHSGRLIAAVRDGMRTVELMDAKLDMAEKLRQSAVSRAIAAQDRSARLEAALREIRAVKPGQVDAGFAMHKIALAALDYDDEGRYIGG